MAIEAVRLAFKYMSPVFYLSDGYLANGAEPWAIPEISDLPKIEVKFASDPANFMPYSRDPETLARPYAIPGTPGLEHRIGGIEKQHITGNVNYDPENHHLMVKLRQEKIDRAANDIPPVEVFREKTGKVLVLGWGSTYGSISTAVEKTTERRQECFRRTPALPESIPKESGRGACRIRNGDHPGDEPGPTVHHDSREVSGRRGCLLES